METFGLTPLQQGMYYHHLLEPDSGVHLEQIVIDLPGDIDPRCLESAWNLVIDRHEVLRAGIELRADGGGPWASRGFVHRIHKTAAIEFSYVDWSGADAESETLQYLEGDRRRPFDLRTPPLMRVLLARSGPGAFRLFLTLHHIIIDGPSLVFLLRDAFACYEALCAGRIPALPPAPSFRPYVEWLDAGDQRPASQYWRAELTGFTAPTPLPVDLVDPKELGARRFGEVVDRLSADETAALQSYARSQDVTVNTLLHGAWALLLAGHSGESDIVFGVTKTTRSGPAPNRESAVGPYLATLPLRVACDGAATPGEFLRAIRSRWVSLRPYEHASLTDIAEWCEWKGGGLFDSLVLYHSLDYADELRALSTSWSGRWLRIHEETNSALTLVGTGGTELELKLEFDHRRYSHAAAHRYLGAIRHILFQFCREQPGRTIAAIDVVGPEERHRLLHEWNNAHAEYDTSLRVQDLFLRQVASGPDRVAVRGPKETLTYGALNDRANAIAAGLAGLGIGRGSVVGISLDRSVNMVAALLAVFKCGAAYVPIDPAFPPDRALYMAEDSGVVAVLMSAASAGLLGAARARLIDVDELLLSAASRGDVDGGGTSDDLAYVLYTSGSTGRPKGVEISQASLVNFLLSMAKRPGIGPDDVLLSVTTLSFDISGLEIYLPLVSGAQVVLLTSETTVDGRELLRAMNEHRPTLMQATPATWRMLIASGWKPTPALTALCGGEALPADLADQIRQRATLWNMYGPTETTIWSTCAYLPSGTPVTIGRPIDNTTVYILDAGMRPVPIGATGELLIGGAGLARGYRGRPELTAERFLPVAAAGGERLYRTGDLARYWSDGRIECLGRSDSQVKIRGFRVELGEVEGALNALPGIAESVVVARGDVSGSSMLVGYYIPAVPGSPGLPQETLRAGLGRTLPGYMIPSIFVALEEFPLTPNRKVDRRRLPAPAPPDAAGGEEPGPGISEDERRMIALWESVLGVRGIRLADRFLEVGGHSLLAVELLVAIEDTFGISLPIVAIVENPTAGELTAALVTRGKPVPDGGAPATATG
jgi:amino acid adenylation domain-containing protein